MRSLLTFCIAAAALVAVYAGPFVLLPVVIAVNAAFGGEWGFVALGGALAACVGVLWVLFRIADLRTSHLEPSGGPAPKERLFCLVCGALAAPDDVVCGSCGGTRFGLARRAAAAQAALVVASTVVPAPASPVREHPSRNVYLGVCTRRPASRAASPRRSS